jgi:hypothetical protein
MSILTVTTITWLNDISNMITSAHTELPAYENRYYEPYNMLLVYCFFDIPIQTPLRIAPQKAPYPYSHDLVDFVISSPATGPVLFLKIKDDSWATSPDRRLKADTQMRQRFKDMSRHCRVPLLWGLSLLGTRLRVYVCDIAHRQVTPPLTQRPSPYLCLPQDFLADGWNVEVTSQEGFESVRDVVADIVANVNNMNLIT